MADPILAGLRNRQLRQPMAAIKPSNTTRSSTSLAIDPHLQVPVEAGTDYEVELYLAAWGAHAPGDLNIKLCDPSGITSHYTFAHDEGGTVYRWNTGYDDTSVVKVATWDGTTVVSAHIRGWVSIGVTAGSYALYWGADTGGGSGTTVGKGSRMYLRKISP
jgi:hypothetical protein